MAGERRFTPGVRYDKTLLSTAPIVGTFASAPERSAPVIDGMDFRSARAAWRHPAERITCIPAGSGDREKCARNPRGTAVVRMVDGILVEKPKGFFNLHSRRHQPLIGTTW